LKKKEWQYACRLFRTNSLKEGKTNAHLSRQITKKTFLGLPLPFLETAKESTYWRSDPRARLFNPDEARYEH
jgi:hypothetical protein